MEFNTALLMPSGQHGQKKFEYKKIYIILCNNNIHQDMLHPLKLLSVVGICNVLQPLKSLKAECFPQGHSLFVVDLPEKDLRFVCTFYSDPFNGKKNSQNPKSNLINAALLTCSGAG